MARGMSKAIVLSRHVIRSEDCLRGFIVLGCALALILARQPLPFL